MQTLRPNVATGVAVGLRPFFMLLFTQVPRRGIPRSSQVRSSTKFVRRVISSILKALVQQPGAYRTRICFLLGIILTA